MKLSANKYNNNNSILISYGSCLRMEMPITKLKEIITTQSREINTQKNNRKLTISNKGIGVAG